MPVKLRHNVKLIFTSIIAIALLGVFLGSVQLGPVVFTTGGTLVSNTVEYIEGNIDFFDLSQPHSISLTVDSYQLEELQTNFLTLGEKSWIVTDAIIDGTFIPDVGIRLKGNSTLFGLGGPNDPPNPFPPTIGSPTFENPATLPFLLSFSKFSEGRVYQGHSDLAIRTGANGGTAANEAIALQLIADSGQYSQKYSFITMQVNDLPSTTRLVIENPDQGYAVGLNKGEGVLYKSRSDNTFTYQGEDPNNYVEEILQVSAIGVRDLSPVLELLNWIETVSDEVFDNEFENWIDIPSFSKYVVTNDLLSNWDDMDGPGHNFLLWFDVEDDKFTVINWDLNQSLSPEGAALGEMLGFGVGGGAAQMWGKNPLKSRFINSGVFTDDLANAYSEINELWFGGELTNEIINEFSNIIPVTDTLNAEQIENDLEKLKYFIEEWKVL
ncbi:MAG: CotH kinase family protein [Gammaproteobacteria bacterium]|nr:CotH kinase family protein [Gammaproteobacteria bacterium]